MKSPSRLLKIALAAASISSGSIVAAHAAANACEPEIVRAAERYQIPIGILYAVGLAETGVEQRALRACAPSGFEPRSVIAEIVLVRPVRNGSEPELGAEPLGDLVELALIVEAAIGAVLGVALAVEFVRLDELVTPADRRECDAGGPARWRAERTDMLAAAGPRR